MTPTSDERREVAARLRQASHTDANLDVTIAIAILDTIGEVHRPIAAVVADLIDPTCEFEESVENDEFLIRVVSIYFCRACGHRILVERPVSGPAEPPHYCSNCGARVMSGDDE